VAPATVPASVTTPLPVTPPITSPFSPTPVTSAALTEGGLAADRTPAVESFGTGIQPEVVRTEGLTGRDNGSGNNGDEPSRFDG
jgi:hypothetical protein